MPKTDEEKNEIIAADQNPPGGGDAKNGKTSGSPPALNNRDEAENWLKALYTGLVNLKIITVITDNPDQTEQSIQTNINLIDGDIRTSIHKHLAKNLDVFAFHKEQVQKGETIIRTNVETVKTLADGLLDLFTG